MPGPIRRIAPSNAAARGTAARSAEAPPKTRPKPTSSRIEVQAKGHVSTTVKDRDGPYHDTSAEVELDRREFGENQHPTFVKVGGGLTINLGQFESLRIDVSITIPCLYEERESAYEEASQFVADKCAEEEINWLGQSKPKVKK